MVIANAKKYGVRVIFPFVNFEPDLTGECATLVVCVGVRGAVTQAGGGVPCALPRATVPSRCMQSPLQSCVCRDCRRIACRQPSGPQRYFRPLSHTTVLPDVAFRPAGMQFYVDNSLGTGWAREYFYASSQVGMRAAMGVTGQAKGPQARGGQVL